jgi:hypothetical protein
VSLTRRYSGEVRQSPVTGGEIEVDDACAAQSCGQKEIETPEERPISTTSVQSRESFQAGGIGLAPSAGSVSFRCDLLTGKFGVYEQRYRLLRISFSTVDLTPKRKTKDLSEQTGNQELEKKGRKRNRGIPKWNIPVFSTLSDCEGFLVKRWEDLLAKSARFVNVMSPMFI